MKSAEILRAERLQLLDEAQALGDQAKAGDELTDDQQARFDELTADDGPIAVATEAVEKQERFEARMAAIEKQRASDEARSTGWAGGPSKQEPADASQKPDIKLLGQKSRHFEDPKQAKAAAEWLAACNADSREDREAHLTIASQYGGEVYAAQSIGTDGKGGYLVPEPISTQILKYRDEVAVAPQLANRIGMTTETLRINEESGDLTVYYPGESGAITPSDVDYTPHTLTVTKRAVMNRMSREFIADVNVSAIDQIIDNMAYKLAYAVDDEYINGDGTATYGGETGLIAAATQTVVAPSGTDTIEELVLGDLKSLKNAINLRYQRGASWLFKPEAWQHVELLLLQAGGAATAEFAAGFTGSPRFLDKPVYQSDLFPAEAASSTVAIYGDFRLGTVIGDRNDMSVDMSTERYFEFDDVAVRGTHRYDILVHKAETYATLELAAS